MYPDPSYLAALFGPAKARGLLRLLGGVGFCIWLCEAQFSPIFVDCHLHGALLQGQFRGQACRRFQTAKSMFSASWPTRWGLGSPPHKARSASPHPSSPDGQRVRCLQGTGAGHTPSLAARGRGRRFRPTPSCWGFRNRGFRRVRWPPRGSADLCPVGQGFRTSWANRRRLA